MDLNFDMTNQNLLLLVTSLGIGLLIGMERGWQARDVKDGQRIAGIRTYALIGLLGGLTGFISNHMGGIALGLICFGFSIFVTAAHAINSRNREDVSITGLIAVFLTFLLGVMATMGFVAEAASVAIVSAMILRFKSEIHSWLNKIEKHELHAALELLLISVVLLNVLPDKNYGPWMAFNPFEIWWLVVLVASISFVGYFAMKIAGAKKGILFTGLFSGFVSSTALTLHFSKFAKEKPELSKLLSLGILIACSVMFLRLLLVMALLNVDLFAKLVGPALLTGSVIILIAFMNWKKNANLLKPHEERVIKNPLALKAALIFGVLLTVVGIAVRAVNHYAGETGLYTFSALTGLVDMDSIALSLARMITEPSQVQSFTIAILIATWANTLLKGVLACVIGGRQMLMTVTLPLITGVICSMIWVYMFL